MTNYCFFIKQISVKNLLIKPNEQIFKTNHLEFLFYKNTCKLLWFSPLVELVPSPTTDSDVLVKTKELMKLSGMIPVVLKKEIDGFAVNRLQYALLGEAYRLVEDEILTAKDVDLVVSKGLGLRYFISN